MAKDKLPGSVMLDLYALSKNVKKVAPVSVTSPSGDVPNGTGQPMGSVAGSGTKEAAEQKFMHALTKAMLYAEKQVQKTLARAVLTDRVREAINAKYGNRMSPGDISKMAREAVNSLGYEISSTLTVPESMQHSVAATDPKIVYDADDDL